MPSVIDENTQFIDPLTSTPIVNGYIYIGANGLDAELNAITIYSDRDLNPATPLSNPQRTDSSGRSVNKIWIPGRYSMKVTDSADVQKLNDLDLGELVAIGTTKLTNVQGSDIITAEGSPTIATLTDGQLYVFTTILANTGAVTLQIDATPIYPIKKNHDVALVANDLESSQMIVVAWNSTDSVYELQSSIARASNTLNGQELILNVDTSITADTANQIDFRMAGTDSIVMKSGALNLAKGADIASATTTDIGAATGNFPDITGSATITALGTAQAGAERETRTTGSPLFTYNATSLILPGDANIQAQPGDVQKWRSLGSGNWICTNYQVDTISPIQSGTWIPTLQDSSFSDSEGQTYSLQEGHYMKVGSMVFITCAINLTSLGTLTITDPAYISGLPFTPSASLNGGGVTAYLGFNLNIGGSITGVVNPGSSAILLREWSTSGSPTLAISKITASGGVYLQGFYLID